MTIDLAVFYKFLLLLLRASFIVFFAPVIGSRSVPAVAKIALASFLAYSQISFIENIHVPETVVELLLVVFRELLLGMSIGFASRLIFDGIQLGGQYVGYMMGFSIVNVVDPQAEAAVPLISHFENIIAVLFFLAIGGHLWFLSAFVDSLKIVPIEELSVGLKWTMYAVHLGEKIFVIGLKVNAPIFVVLFLIQLVMAIIARVVPQMNIFMVGFPIQIFVGLLLLAFSIRGMVALFTSEFMNMKLMMYSVINFFSG
ncbi:flagellar biosynthetic protein FliR [Thermosulfidibacter takaii ABI70S6]|uniref:Flagellar biosynthetic protein FliR n=1 Tax=Thermosulfidibacter takaii (strain DSM 17441 / JCM 13301 / NBRC 103674 / ABI70S6) TaxID=1298851 RepID=A0A0S3QT28_THET7|nr:flagellar biosynthetic protein FliR [Thermosulfidibacter takaii]BAT71452.1 flagellar biosynthetic protein FliR [Thermosulfidibacter takaii ABI70S6]